MDGNNPKNDWVNEGIYKTRRKDPDEKYERFYYIWKRRIHNDWNSDKALNDAPDGFQDWFKRRHIK